MPTKKQRVGFIPREDVMRIIDKLSIENNLSNSKIVSILVEEALTIRGIFNKKSGKMTQSYRDINTHFNPSKSTLLNNENQEVFDLQTYKKFISFLKFQEMMDKYNT